MMICVYGTFNNKDIKIKTYEDEDSRIYSFQNILREAGYDAEIFSVSNPSIGNLYRAYVRDEDGVNILIRASYITRAEEIAKEYFETDSVTVWRMSSTGQTDVWKDEE